MVQSSNGIHQPQAYHEVAGNSIEDTLVVGWVVVDQSFILNMGISKKGVDRSGFF